MCSSSSGIHINALIAAFIVYFCSTFLFFYYHLLNYQVPSSKYDVLAIGNSSFYYQQPTNHLTYSIAEIDSAEKNNSLFNGSNQLMNRSFSDHQLWYQKKMNRITENLSLGLSHITNNTTKKILLWTQHFNALPSPFLNDSDWFRSYSCPVWQCEVIRWDKDGKNLKESGIPVEQFDAVVFTDAIWFNYSIPTKRSPHQRYVFWGLEPPGLHSHIKEWEVASNFFNWTMTYRWDSDIVAPYGYTRNLTSAELPSRSIKKNYAEGKSKFAIWIASRCTNLNGRREYVSLLQKYISLDIYGSCGHLKCERGKQAECREMMSRDYKFVIAFENSLCWDYVSEKMFYNANYNVIPIVIDLHGNYERFAPPKSYINALDFPSVKELADYLNVLDKNDTLYNEYFWWKESYAMEYAINVLTKQLLQPAARGYCELCSKLHDPNQPVSIVENLTMWWNDDAKCKVLTFPYLMGNSTIISNNDTWLAKGFPIELTPEDLIERKKHRPISLP